MGMRLCMTFVLFCLLGKNKMTKASRPALPDQKKRAKQEKKKKLSDPYQIELVRLRLSDSRSREGAETNPDSSEFESRAREKENPVDT